jgi:lactate dehydrogenase-like 2-hydroxyacid dehydrogenase
MKKFQRLVVLDKVDFFDEQLEELKKLAENVTVYEDTAKTKMDVIKRVGSADAVITSWTDLDIETIRAWPNVKYMGIWATGYSWIDVKAAIKQGITVTNVPGYAAEAVAELLFGQLISLLRNTEEADKRAREGKFDRAGLLGEELQGKTIGIIGLGRVGTRVAEIAKAFNMNVVYFSRTRKPEYEGDTIKYLELEQLLRVADIVTIHTPGGAQTIGKKEIALLKNGAIVANLGVGGVIDEAALIEELQKGRLRAVMDNYEHHEIKTGFRKAHGNTILTPEIGFYTKQAVKRLTQICINNAKSYLEDKTQNKLAI